LLARGSVRATTVREWADGHQEYCPSRGGRT
jgi:hypothetical protein